MLATATSSRGNSRPCSCMCNGVAYLQVGVVQVVAGCGCVVARSEFGSLKQWSMMGFDPSEVGTFRRIQQRSPLNHGDF